MATVAEPRLVKVGTSLSGKTAVVTGANSGIGKETAVALAKMGARVVCTARNEEKGRSAVAEIARRAGNDQVELSVFDLSSMGSVRSGAADILQRCPRIEILVNNAGLVLSQRSETVDGFESTFAINHLGPFLLTTLLLERIKASTPARIVNVASSAHSGARHGLNFDDLQFTKGYGSQRAYAASKLANILFTSELSRRLEGTGVAVNCVHPGTVRTGWSADGDVQGLLRIGVLIARPFMLSPTRGAATSVYVASSPEVDGITGKYFVRCKVHRPRPPAEDAEAARRLWEVSAKLVEQA